jgi:hypothetical protein
MSKVLESLIPTVDSKEVKNSSKAEVSSANSSKSSPSLFDSLLKNKTKNEKATEDTKIKKSTIESKDSKSALQTYKNSSGENTNISLVKQKLSKIEVEKKVPQKPTSLMDSMIKDAKKIKESKQADINQSKDISSKTNQKVKIESSDKKLKLQSTNTEIKPNNTVKKLDEQKVGSLMDNIIKDTTKIKNSKELKEPKKADVINKLEDKQDDKKSQNDLKKSNSKIDKFINNDKKSQNNLKISNSKIDKFIKDENISKKQNIQTKIEDSKNNIKLNKDIDISTDLSNVDKKELKEDLKTTKSKAIKLDKQEIKKDKIAQNPNPTKTNQEPIITTDSKNEPLLKEDNSVSKIKIKKTNLQQQKLELDTSDKKVTKHIIKDDQKDIIISKYKEDQKDLNIKIDELVVDENIDKESIFITAKDEDKKIDKSNNKKIKSDDIKLDIKLDNIDSKIVLTTTNSINSNIEDKTVISNNKEVKSKNLNLKQQENKIQEDLIKPNQNENLDTKIDNSVSNTKEPLFANIYMGAQKHIKDLASMQQKQEGMTQLKDGATIKDIEKSASILELNPDEVKIQTKEQQKTSNKNTISNNNDKMLNKLAFNKNILHEDLNNIDDAVVTQSNQVNKTIHKEQIQKNITTVEVNVPASVVQTIEHKIIGAKQQMSQMMSDIARQMAQNYKPPVTTFKINLNPNGLGNIAVVMKSDKSNGLNISLSMSKSSTRDTFIDNQTVLRTALSRNFDMQSQFTLEFNMQNNPDNQDQSSFNQQSNQNNDSSSSNQKNDEKLNNDVEENISSDYM